LYNQLLVCYCIIDFHGFHYVCVTKLVSSLYPDRRCYTACRYCHEKCSVLHAKFWRQLQVTNGMYTASIWA